MEKERNGKQLLPFDRYRRMHCDLACAEIETERRLKKISNPSADTIQRKDIHRIIKEMVYQGKSKLEIMAALYNQFPDSNCISFFPGWIDDQITKRMKELAKENDGEER